MKVKKERKKSEERMDVNEEGIKESEKERKMKNE